MTIDYQGSSVPSFWRFDLGILEQKGEGEDEEGVARNNRARLDAETNLSTIKACESPYPRTEHPALAFASTPSLHLTTRAAMSLSLLRTARRVPLSRTLHRSAAARASAPQHGEPGMGPEGPGWSDPRPPWMYTRCELSICPRSASNESAADDLYALERSKVEGTWRKAGELGHVLNIIPHTTQ